MPKQKFPARISHSIHTADFAMNSAEVPNLNLRILCLLIFSSLSLCLWPEYLFFSIYYSPP